MRTAACRQCGFKLDPEAFPYKDKIPSSGVMTFDPLAGNRADFGSLAEQMFAAEIRRREAADTIQTWGKRIGIAAGSLVLVVFLNWAGAAIAGAAFTEQDAANLEFLLKKGAANILTLELEAAPGGRRYDVVMKNGEKFELKNWSEWEGGKLDSIRDQFLYDFGYGNKVIDMHWKTYRYVFRAPAPDPIKVLRATFRGWPEKAMIDGGVNPDTRAKTLAAFDAHAADIILEGPGFWSGTPAAKVSPPTIPMPVQDKGDKDQPSPPPGSNR